MKPHLVLFASLVVACTEAAPGAPPDAASKHLDGSLPDAAVLDDALSPPDVAGRATRAELERALSLPARLDPETLRARFPTSAAPAGPVDPRTAAGFDALQASALSLQESEVAALGRQGFVLSERRSAVHFVGGYLDVFRADLPVYVTADAVLHAMHAGFDEVVALAETWRIAPALARWLADARAQLATARDLPAPVKADLDLHLSVAAALLSPTPLADLSPDATAMVARVTAAGQPADVNLFGAARSIDFSQFEPRGHYTLTPELQRYFRAMMWIGREGFRVVDVVPDTGERVLRRRQLLDVLALRALLTPAMATSWAQVEGAIAAAMGEPDDLTFHALPALSQAIGGRPVDERTDAQLIAAIDAIRGDLPRVAGAILRGDGMGTRALPVAFSIFPQRYTPDAMALANVVYDRVNQGRVRRMMPDPLDAAFAALGNDHALSHLGPSLARDDYATELFRARVLIDAHEPAYWQSSLASAWVGALRTLSPRAASAAPDTLPAVARSAAWQTRLLNAQMASWAEYRHDTILSARQSYTGSPACSYPAGYVDPYPSFYAAVEAWASLGRGWVERLPAGGEMDYLRPEAVTAWFERVRGVAANLRAMAERERAGMPFTDAQLAWLNRAITAQGLCGSQNAQGGWYVDLFRSSPVMITDASVVADVHTQPTDASGNTVGRVLHVGTGRPRMIAVAVQNCEGPRVYVGFVSSYFERVTEGFTRLTDQAWRMSNARGNPADVPWMAPLVVR